MEIHTHTQNTREFPILENVLKGKATQHLLKSICTQSLILT